jgi:hypothetical protein
VERRGTYRVLVGKHRGKRPLEGPTPLWEDDNRMDLKEICYGSWTGFSWLRIKTSTWML